MSITSLCPVIFITGHKRVRRGLQGNALFVGWMGNAEGWRSAWGSEGDEFFGEGWMDAYGLVEVGLGGAAVHGYGESLGEFAGVGGRKVKSDDSPGFAVDDELDEGLFVPAAETVFHGTGLGLVNFVCFAAGLGLDFGAAHGGDVRVAEYGARDVPVVHLAVLFAEQAAGDELAFGERHRGQGDTVDHVTHREYARLRGFKVAIDLNGAPGTGPDGGVLKAEVLGHGPATCCAESFSDAVFLAGIEDYPQLSGVDTLDFCDLSIQFQLKLAGQGPSNEGSQIFVESSQQFVATINERDFHAEAVEDTGELGGDIAAAVDEYCPWQLRKVKYFIRSNGQLIAWKRIFPGPTACGKENAAGAVTLAAHFHEVGPGESCAFAEDPDSPACEDFPIHAIKAADFPVLVGEQRFPVELGGSRVPAKTAAVLPVFGIMGGIAEQFLGHAAHIDAGAAKIALFRHRDPGAEVGGNPARAHAAGAGANDKKVKIERFQGFSRQYSGR